MNYTALDIARYIITYCCKKSTPISNLQLQKILYFLWIDFYKQTGRDLFSDNICAWPLGPVVPVVYNEFCVYAGIPISEKYDVNIDNDDAIIIDDILEKYVHRSAYDLVNQSHVSGGAWDTVYDNKKGIYRIIPFSKIRKLEK